MAAGTAGSPKAVFIALILDPDGRALLCQALMVGIQAHSCMSDQMPCTQHLHIIWRHSYALEKIAAQTCLENSILLPYQQLVSEMGKIETLHHLNPSWRMRPGSFRLTFLADEVFLERLSNRPPAAPSAGT